LPDGGRVLACPHDSRMLWRTTVPFLDEFTEFR